MPPLTTRAPISSDLDLIRSLRSVGAAAVQKRLAAFERVVEHCAAGKGCRRRALLAHFGDETSAAVLSNAAAHDGAASTAERRRPCCDACDTPAKVAAAAGELSVARLRSAAGAAGARSHHAAPDEAEAARGARKRVRDDPHDTGLVDGEASDQDADDDGIARAGSSRGGGAPVVARRGPKLNKAQLGARLGRLEAREAEQEEEEREMSAAEKLRARMMR